MTSSPVQRRVPHGELTLALHELRAAGGNGGGSTGEDGSRALPLLLVHDLEGASTDWTTPARATWSRWPGPVLALDLAGHGASDWRDGGAYTPELFAADIDAVLATVGPCAIAGAGIGAYAALLVAGARPDLVPAVLLLPGRGLEGGGPELDVARAPAFLAALDDIAALRASSARPATDPLTTACATDLRPPDYALGFAARARRILLAEDGLDRPPWWTSIRGESRVETAPAGSPLAFDALVARSLVDPAAG